MTFASACEDLTKRSHPLAALVPASSPASTDAGDPPTLDSSFFPAILHLAAQAWLVGISHLSPATSLDRSVVSDDDPLRRSALRRMALGQPPLAPLLKTFSRSWQQRRSSQS